MSQKIVSIRP